MTRATQPLQDLRRPFAAQLIRQPNAAQLRIVHVEQNGAAHHARARNVGDEAMQHRRAVAFDRQRVSRFQVSTAGGGSPLWAHNGKELFFRNNHNDLVSAQIVTSPSFTVTSQKTLFPLTGMAFSAEIQPYVVGLDDKRFLMLRETAAAEAGLLVVNEHFFNELSARTQK